MKPFMLSAVLALAAAAASAPCGAQGAAQPHAAPVTVDRRYDRWQILLNNGTYLYEVRVLGARGDTLRIVQPEGPRAVPLDDIDELRLVQASEKRVGEGARATFAGLVGADDMVFKLSKFDPAERRRIVDQVLRERSESAPDRP